MKFVKRAKTGKRLIIASVFLFAQNSAEKKAKEHENEFMKILCNLQFYSYVIRCEAVKCL